VSFALSRSKSVEGDSWAEELLLEMRSDSARGQEGASLTSNLFCHNAVLHAWCCRGDPRASDRAGCRCEIVFDQLQTAYEDSEGDTQLRPNSSSYSLLIGCCVEFKGALCRSAS